MSGVKIQMDPRALGHRGSALSLLDRFFLLLCQIAGLVLIFLGVYLAYSIFVDVTTHIKEPETFGEPMKQIGELIGADQLQLPGAAADDKMPIGKLVTMGVLYLWYVFWAWIPLAMLKAGLRLVWGPS